MKSPNIESAAPTADIAAFDSSWDPDTVQAVFDESVKVQALFPEWSDAVDRKTITIFTLATGIATVTPAFLRLGGVLTTNALVFIVLAAIAWLAAAISCYVAYAPRDIRIGPSPQILLDKLWIGRSPVSYRYYRIRDMGKTFEHNCDQITRKAWWLKVAMIATIAEVILLSLAYLAQPLLP